jgi:hypothetical protein
MPHICALSSLFVLPGHFLPDEWYILRVLLHDQGRSVENGLCKQLVYGFSCLKSHTDYSLTTFSVSVAGPTEMAKHVPLLATIGREHTREKKYIADKTDAIIVGVPARAGDVLTSCRNCSRSFAISLTITQ